MTAARVTLPVLDARIEARARATREAHPWWPCAKGCDLCCRSLPRLPEISAPEWERLREALSRLDARRIGEITSRIRSAPAEGPLTCPMLDRDQGACLVYDARPVACRTYGFYTDRDAGLHCGEVLWRVEERAGDDPVVWGNGEAIAEDVRSFGEPVSLRDWLEVPAPPTPGRG